MDADLGRVEHGDAEDVAIFRGTRADDLSEEADADTHDLARLPTFERLLLRFLLLPQLCVAERIHRFLHSQVIVAGVVLPTERRLVRKLLAADEVLHAQRGRIHTKLVRQDVHRSLDAIGGLGDAKRTTISDAPGRFVAVDAIDGQMRNWEVIRASDDIEEARRP